MPIRTYLLAAGVVLASVSACGGDGGESGAGAGGSTGAAPSTAKVAIADFEFQPKQTKVKAGGTVSFTNDDKARHNAETDDGAEGAFDTRDLEQGDSRQITFEKPGSYAYYCVYHRFMTGTVEVVG